MSSALHPVFSVDDLLRLAPLDRLEALIDGVNFAPYLREEPITFDMHDPIYGYGCGVQGCAQHSTQAAWWCTRHAQERWDAVRSGFGEANWKARAIAFPAKGSKARWMAGCRPVVSARTGMLSLTISAAGIGHSATKLA